METPLLPSIYFYPRSHVGNDALQFRAKVVEKYFYPRSHVGNDVIARALRHFIEIFLSTFPRRERRLSDVQHRQGEHFYPRSHVGNDGGEVIDTSGMEIDFYPRSHVGNDGHPR